MKGSSFSGCRTLVIGLGISGLGAVKVLCRREALVSVYDDRTIDAFARELIDELDRLKVEVFAGQFPEVVNDSYDLIVVSPGIPKELEILEQARLAGVPVIGEVELAYRVKAKEVEFLGITGTNGKTTTTALLHHLFLTAGMEAVLGGNIGFSLAAQVDLMPDGIICAELSSFQLDTIVDFQVRIGAVLNITPDHLDRHKTMEAYIEAKANILKNQHGKQSFILNYDDLAVRKLADRCCGKAFFFSLEEALAEGVYKENGQVVINWNNNKTIVADLNTLSLRGRHNLENILCATGMAYLYGLPLEAIAKGIQTFKAVRHRMEEAGVIEGVLYINDSKATNTQSSINALNAFSEPVVLIAGGRGKGADFSLWAQAVKEKAEALIVLGEDKIKIKNAVINTGFTNIYEVENLNQGFALAAKLAEPGGVVLLSPACASWDMFANYEERGDLFCRLVQEANKS